MKQCRFHYHTLAALFVRHMFFPDQAKHHSAEFVVLLLHMFTVTNKRKPELYFPAQPVCVSPIVYHNIAAAYTVSSHRSHV